MKCQIDFQISLVNVFYESESHKSQKWGKEIQTVEAAFQMVRLSVMTSEFWGSNLANLRSSTSNDWILG